MNKTRKKGKYWIEKLQTEDEYRIREGSSRPHIVLRRPFNLYKSVNEGNKEIITTLAEGFFLKKILFVNRQL